MNSKLRDLILFTFLAILAGLVVFLLGHVLNTVLGIMGGGIHSIRLHYVESNGCIDNADLSL